MMLLLAYILLTATLGSSGDGLNNRGIQTWGHLLKALEIAALLWLSYLFNLSTINEGAAVFSSYICIRVATFDLVRNLVAGRDIFYMGGKNWWDMLLKRQNSIGVTFGRLIFLIAGVWVVFSYLT